MQELVIVLPDLILPGLQRGGSEAEGLEAPSLAQAARLGTRHPIPGGWRSWLAGWAGRSPEAAPAGGRSFLARPMHLVAGLTDVHADLRSILELTDAELGLLAEDFGRVFFSGTLALRPLGAGELLLEGVDCAATQTTEPAVAVMRGIGASLPRGPGAAALRRLHSELEMWLYEHPLNAQRLRRGLPAATALWLWNEDAAVPAAADPFQAATQAHGTPVFFGGDAWTRGLARRLGSGTLDPPPQIESLLSYPAGRAVLWAPLVPLLQQDPAVSPNQALARIDRSCVEPAVRAVRRRRLLRLHILVNGWRIELAPGAWLRFWRRTRGLAESIG